MPGYFGINCQNVLTPCNSSPCNNNGTCTDLRNGLYTCVCAYGYTGTNCELLINQCLSNPCVNNGICSMNSRMPVYVCVCLAGYTGTRYDIINNINILLIKFF